MAKNRTLQLHSSFLFLSSFSYEQQVQERESFAFSQPQVICKWRRHVVNIGAIPYKITWWHLFCKLTDPVLTRETFSRKCLCVLLCSGCWCSACVYFVAGSPDFLVHQLNWVWKSTADSWHKLLLHLKSISEILSHDVDWLFHSCVLWNIGFIKWTC